MTEHLDLNTNHATNSLPPGTLCRVRGSKSRYQDTVVLVLDTGIPPTEQLVRREPLGVLVATFRGTAKLPLNELRPVTAVERLGFIADPVTIKVPIMVEPHYGHWVGTLHAGFGKVSAIGDDAESAGEACLAVVRALIDAPAGVMITG